MNKKIIAGVIVAVILILFVGYVVYNNSISDNQVIDEESSLEPTGDVIIDALNDGISSAEIDDSVLLYDEEVVESP
ncbi:hypothetical protein HYW76_04730 [Candidatus Pacearchaeota archaeon]|nr:hypothetical protein [Candidatus Pacearchaeota archaeon]